MIDMTPEEKDHVLRSAIRRGYSPNEVKGWCEIEKKPVVRYHVSCILYEPNREPPRERTTLDKWLGGGKK